MFSRLVSPEKKKDVVNVRDFIHSKKEIAIDLNSDKKEDRLIFLKKNGLDIVRVLDENKKSVFEGELQTKGEKSRVFKARLVSLNEDTNTVIIYFYEGSRQSHLYEAGARVYFLTIPKNNLNNISLFEGGHFFHEKLELDEIYFLKEFSVNVVDYNKDGVKEISLVYFKSSRVYHYLGKGKWMKI